jgi:MoxR-like ATPase
MLANVCKEGWTKCATSVDLKKKKFKYRAFKKNAGGIPPKRDDWCMYLPETGVFAVLHPLRADVHLWEVQEALKKGEDVSQLGASNEALTFGRLCQEANNSWGYDSPPMSDEVTEKVDVSNFLPRDLPFVSAIDTLNDGKKKEPWQSIDKPEGFFVTTRDWQALLYAALHGKNVLLTGPTGSGKSELVWKVAKATGLSIEAFNFGAMQEPRSTLIGNTNFDPKKGTFFNESRFVKAVKKESGVMLWDELSRAVGDAHNIVMTLCDRQQYLALDESEDAGVVYRGANVAVIATANVGAQYTGTYGLDRALKDRFVKIDIDYPPAEHEEQVILHRFPAIPKDWARSLVNAAWRQRGLARDGEFTEEISTRMLLDCAEWVVTGILPQHAIEITVLNNFSAEGATESERQRIREIFINQKLIEDSNREGSK